MTTKPTLFAAWWQALDLLLHERDYALSGVLIAKSYHEAGHTPQYAFRKMHKRRAEWAQ